MDKIIIEYIEVDESIFNKPIVIERPFNLLLNQRKQQMAKLKELVNEDSHLQFCDCPDITDEWKMLDKNFSENFKKSTAHKLGCPLLKEKTNGI